METTEVQLHRGLRGIYIDNTQASFIDGNVGKLLYRGYDIHELAEKSTFEETMYLLLHGQLPTRAQLSAFDAEFRAARPVPAEVTQIIRLVQRAHPMDVLRTAVSALAAFDPDVTDDSPEAILRKGIRLTAQAATVVTAHERVRHGLDPVPPDPSLNHAGNFLYMLRGKRPDPEEANIMDVDFILHAEHSSNASAFASRVTASTLSDLHSAVVTGIGTLKGPLHGGAAEKVMEMAEAIGQPERAEEYVRETLKSHGRIMGFGHAVYKAEDPRARHLRDRSKVLGEKRGEPQWFQILTVLEQKAMVPYRARGIYVNVDFFAGSVYHLLGIPSDLFISIFAMGRIPGWTLQVMEQQAHNMLLRPLLNYTGPMDLPYVPIQQRG